MADTTYRSPDLDRRAREDMLAGLSATPRRMADSLPYDPAGSALFETITRLSNDYPPSYPSDADAAMGQAGWSERHTRSGGAR